MTTIDFNQHGFHCIYDKRNTCNKKFHTYDILSVFDIDKEEYSKNRIYLASDIIYDTKAVIKISSKENFTGSNEIDIYNFLKERIFNYNDYFPDVYAIFECSENYYLIMEYIEGNKFNLKTFSTFDNTKKLNIIKKICLIVEKFHSLEIVINDLKEDNILLDKYDNPMFIDFGMCVSFDQYNNMIQKCQGTALYMPPELLIHNLSNKSHANKKDIWALGIIIYELFIYENPVLCLFNFHDTNMIPSFNNIIFDNSGLDNAINEMVMLYDSYCEDYENDSILLKIGKIIFKCLTIDPEDRPTIKDILSILE